VTAAILVGGAARRLDGTVKPSLRVGNERIVDRQLRALADVGIGHITLVGSWRDAPIVAPGVHHVADAVEGGGALGGLYTALLAGTGAVVIVLAGDMPFLTPAWLGRLADVGAASANVPRIDGRWHPLCAAYRRHAAGHLKARLDRGALRVIDALGDLRVRELTAHDVAPFDAAGMLMMNVNTPDDYREAERLAHLRT
jgi:molybdopterin-guanine dinucleotide biosynthesis protein A